MIRTLSGANGFLVKRELDRLVDEFSQKHSDLAVQRIDAAETDYSEILTAISNISMFDPIKMVIVRSGSQNKQLVENIEHIIASVPDSTEVIFVEDKLDKRLVYYKTLKKSTEFQEFADVDSRNLPSWVAEIVHSQNGKISNADAGYLVDRVGNNQMILANEIEKLLINNPQINREAINQLTEKTVNSSVFDLLEAAFAGKTDRALNIYDELREQKIEPPQIIGMLSWQLYVLSVIKTAGSKPTGEIASEAKLNPYVLNKSSSIARNISLNKLRQLVKDLLDIDVKSKSSNRNSDEMLKLYLIEQAR